MWLHHSNDCCHFGCLKLKKRKNKALVVRISDRLGTRTLFTTHFTLLLNTPIYFPYLPIANMDCGHMYARGTCQRHFPTLWKVLWRLTALLQLELTESWSNDGVAHLCILGLSLQAWNWDLQHTGECEVQITWFHVGFWTSVSQLWGQWRCCCDGGFAAAFKELELAR